MDNAGVEIGPDSYQEVIDALQATDLEGVTGHIIFDEDGNPVKDLTIIEIKDGAYTFYSKY